MERIVLKYTGKKISKIGKNLLKKELNDQEALETREVLENFRYVHIGAMRNFRTLLQRKIEAGGIEDTLVSQRLKRIRSIVFKLTREPSMALNMMSDIGGLRVVCKNLKDVYKLRDSIRASEDQPSFQSKFKREYDYISEVKDDGYRSLHLVYRNKINKCFIEIQLRTKIQHAWATAVEVAGMFRGEDLKQGEGDEMWLEFFRDVSTIFMLKEKNRVDQGLKKAFSNDMGGKYKGMIPIINGFNITLVALDTGRVRDKYYLISLDLDNKRLKYKAFSKNDFDTANKEYYEIEKKNRDNKGLESVLISIDDIKNLRKIYPNYFLDVEEFFKYIEDFLK